MAQHTHNTALVYHYAIDDTFGGCVQRARLQRATIFMGSQHGVDAPARENR